MFGPTSMAIGAGPLYTNAFMGQAPSAAERENARKASSSILRRKSIQIEESENFSRPESWSMHFDCTNQAPYSATEDDDMITQTSLLGLPRSNPSHDLAEFLRTTGPTATHRRPSKLERPQRVPPGPRSALRFLRLRSRRPQTSVAAAHARLNKALNNQDEDINYQDEGGLLVERRVKQKVSSEGTLRRWRRRDICNNAPIGTKYLALEVGNKPNILESEVSVAVFDNRFDRESFDDWRPVRKDKPSRRAPTPGVKRTFSIPFDDEATIVAESQASPGPVRPAASNPPTPEPQSAISVSGSYASNMARQPSNSSLDAKPTLTIHRVPATTSTSLPLLEKSMSDDEGVSKYNGSAKDIELKQPSPRRLASHPVLLQRASSLLVSALPPRSFSDSPGPPPKNPLRLRREPRNIVEVLGVEPERKATPKIAPSIMTMSEYNCEPQAVRSTVVTECSGPIKRPKSRGKGSRIQAAFSISRKEREERIRARKLRDRPITAKTIDAIVNAPPQPPRQRLKKARPHIQVRDVRPAKPTTRPSSTTSSNTSWKKVTEYAHASTSTAPGDEASKSVDVLGNEPNSPTLSNGSTVEKMTLSSVMLVAEEVPATRPKPPPKPSKTSARESKSYAPRPRSASIPRNAMRRRSRQASRTPSRPGSPGGDHLGEDAPPLPSPPPTKALPPPPPPLTIEVPRSKQTIQVSPVDNQKQLPCSPLHEVAPNAPCLRRGARLPHVASQSQRKRVVLKQPNASADDVHLRLEALEKNNALLSAALTAVLRTNGTLNSPASTGTFQGTSQAEVETVRAPMVWESRIARRSAASHGGSSKSSEGEALDLYMSTRHGSKHGL